MVAMQLLLWQWLLFTAGLYRQIRLMLYITFFKELSKLTNVFLKRAKMNQSSTVN